jgi:primosomal protein N' (replication factor Y)
LDDFELFLKDELEFCKDLYTPYKKLLKVLIAHKNREKGIKILTDIQNRLNHFDMQQVEIVGFGEAPISKIAGKYRFQILLRSSLIKELLKIAHILKDIQGVEIDIDPVNFS